MAVTSDDVTQKPTTRTRKPKVVSTDEGPKKVEVVAEEEKVLMRMERGCLSWKTHDGVIFSKEHPYQLVTDAESELLMREGGFRKAHPDELNQWYAE
jgi:hypothetical protein